MIWKSEFFPFNVEISSFGTVSTSSKTKTFPITLNNYTGGEIVITVSAGALVDTTNNSSAEKIYTITPDITRPVWTYQNVEYDIDEKVEKEIQEILDTINKRKSSKRK